MAKRYLPASYEVTEPFDTELKERVSQFEKSNIVRLNAPRRPLLRYLPATATALKPIYRSNIQHQPVSKIMKHLRDVLAVPKAARGL